MPFTEGICPPVQDALTEIYECGTMEVERTGMIDGLRSPFNTNGVLQESIPSNGKRREVEIIGTPMIADTAVQDGRPASFCNAGTEATLFSDKIDVQGEKHVQFFLLEDEIRKICFESDAQLLASFIMTHVNAVKIAVEKDVITQVGAAAGNFYDGSATKPWAPIFPANATNPDQPDRVAAARALKEYRLVGCARPPITIGDDDLDVFMNIEEIACCNQYGIGEGVRGRFAYFNSQFVTAALTDPDQYFTLAPGAVQLLTWNANVGAFAKNNEQEEAGVFMDPSSGMMFDLDLQWDKCNKRWDITISLKYHVYLVNAAELYPANYHKAGTNGILLWNAPSP